MQRTTQRRIKLLGVSVAASLVKEMLVPDVTLSEDKTKLTEGLVGSGSAGMAEGQIYWPIFQLAIFQILANNFGVVPASQSIWFCRFIRINVRIKVVSRKRIAPVFVQLTSIWDLYHSN